jgi:DNA mismatch endonuclease (patch repair protein)
MMASIRGRDTQPEMVVRIFLHSLGFRYRLAPRNLPGKPDVVLPKHNAAIFIHGCFWHGHIGCRFATMPRTRTEFWTGKIAANRARDRIKEAELYSKGWRVAVVWECALKSDRDAALQRLVTFIRSGMKFEEISGQTRR